jgi:hypothetical protein
VIRRGITPLRPSHTSIWLDPLLEQMAIYGRQDLWPGYCSFPLCYDASTLSSPQIAIVNKTQAGNLNRYTERRKQVNESTGVISGVVTPKDLVRILSPLALLLIHYCGQWSYRTNKWVSKLTYDTWTGVISGVITPKYKTVCFTPLLSFLYVFVGSGVILPIIEWVNSITTPGLGL